MWKMGFRFVPLQPSRPSFGHVTFVQDEGFYTQIMRSHKLPDLKLPAFHALYVPPIPEMKEQLCV